MVEAVDDIEEGTLPALVKVRGLEEGALWDAVLPGHPVEVLDVVHGHEALAGSLFVEVGLGLSTGQFVDEPGKDGERGQWMLVEVEWVDDDDDDDDDGDEDDDDDEEEEEEEDVIECWKVAYLQRMTPSLR